jgi:hypothetical protein
MQASGCLYVATGEIVCNAMTSEVAKVAAATAPHVPKEAFDTVELAPPRSKPARDLGNNIHPQKIECSIM